MKFPPPFSHINVGSTCEKEQVGLIGRGYCTTVLLHIITHVRYGSTMIAPRSCESVGFKDLEAKRSWVLTEIVLRKRVPIIIRWTRAVYLH